MEMHEHVCWLYSTEEEHRAFVTAFLRRGLEVREKVVYLVDSHTPDAIFDYLRVHGWHVESLLASGQLEILSSGTTYLQDGSFSPDRMSSFLDLWAHQVVDSSFAGLRVTGEMTWALRAEHGTDRLREYEAKINDYHPPCKSTWVCQYDRRYFDPSDLIDLLASHDSTVLGAGPVGASNSPRPVQDQTAYLAEDEREGPPTGGSHADDCPNREEDLLRQVESMQGRLQGLLDALAESERRYSAIEGLIPFGIWMADAQGYTTYITKALLDAAGVTLDEFRGLKWARLLPPEEVERTLSGWQQCVTTGSFWECEERFLDKEGKYRIVLVEGTPIRNAEGAITGWIGINLDITERKRAEEALRESEELLRSFIDNVPEGTHAYMKDLEGRLILANSRLQEHLNDGSDGWLGKTDLDFHPKELAEAFRANDLKVIETGEPIEVEENDYQEDGLHPYLSVKFPVRDANGNIRAVGGISTDITERKQAEEALRESEERFRAIFEGADIGISLVDMDGNFLAANRALEEMTGYSAEELHDMKFADITHPDDLVAEMEFHHQMVAGTLDCSQLEKRYFCKDGSVIWIRLTASLVRDADGKPQRIIGMMENISERKRSEENQRFLSEAASALASSLDLETTLQTVAELAVLYLADFSAIGLAEKGGFRLVATAGADDAQKQMLCELAGSYAVSESMTGPIWEALAAGKPVVLNDISESLRPSVANSPKAVLMNALGVKSAVAAPLAARGRMFGVLFFAMTASGRRYSRKDVELANLLAHRAALAIDNARLYAAEREARAAAEAATKARDEFLSMASHELRTPLTSLRGFAHMAARNFQKDGAANPEKIRHYFDVIDEQSIRMSALVSQLLDVSRIEAGRIELDRKQADITSLVKGVVARAQMSASHHSFRLSAPPHRPAFVDPVRIEQVLTNLIDNAVKYSPRGGPIEVYVWAPDDETIKVSVRDYGVGIPVEQREGLFSRFYQAHKRGQFGGMGLGLYISREIITMHGGQIDADFPVEGGSCFVITLPAGRDGLDGISDLEGRSATSLGSNTPEHTNR